MSASPHCVFHVSAYQHQLLKDFDETLQLLEHVKASGQQVIVFKPNGFDTREQFEAVHGDALWKTNPDLYDFLVKAEPGRRSNETLGAQIVFTGRRRSQGADRSSLDIFEWDTSYSPPILKVNLLAHWSFDEVWQHIRAHSIRYNVLHDQGYKSVGDYHSTVPTSGSGNEREGRWQGQEKTECGLHKDYFKLKAKALAEKRAAEAAAAAAASAVATTTAVSEAASSAENL
eukprot:jgi/Hompol1/2253/HPOL_005908-RA